MRQPERLNRARALWQVLRSIHFYKKLVPLALTELKVKFPEKFPAPREDSFARIYGPGLCAHELLKRLEKEMFWDQLPLTRPSYEVGTSNGYASRYLFSDRPIDFGSEYLLGDLLESRLPHELQFSANIKFLPLADASLNTVLCSQTVTCIYAPIHSILAEINRVLKPGGCFLFTTHGPAYLRGLPLQGWPEMGLSARDCARRNERRSHYMAHLYTLDEWRQILGVCGFELEKSRGILSLDLARYSQLFYFAENSGPNIFRERYNRGRIGALVRMLFGGEQPYRDCQANYREIMQWILAHELARNAQAPFNERLYLDAGIVAVKRSSVSPALDRFRTPL